MYIFFSSLKTKVKKTKLPSFKASKILGLLKTKIKVTPLLLHETITVILCWC